MSDHPMTGFDSQWESPEGYILGITKHIWEDRGVEDLSHLYTANIPVRYPGGVTIGNQGVIASTWATLEEFPDRQLLGEDVIWSDDNDGGFLSSHRILSTATHVGDGAFGPASHKPLVYRTIADCATRENAIYDEWLVRDVGAMVRQLGHTPEAFAQAQIDSERQAGAVIQPLTPDTGPAAIYTGRGNDHPAGARYADMLRSVARGENDAIQADWDRAAQLEMPGGVTAHGWPAVQTFWGSLRASLGDLTFRIEHQIGRDDPELGPRAALRWWLSGTHTGEGLFAPSTGGGVGSELHLMGISHAEFGPHGLRREWILFDEVAAWKQILLSS